jgi:hypothetical protein
MQTNTVLSEVVADLALAPQVVLSGHLIPGMWKVTTAFDLGAAAAKISPEQLARIQSMGGAGTKHHDSAVRNAGYGRERHAPAPA